MRYLLDTSVWLRSVAEPQTLPMAARQILEGREGEFGLSAISLWEVGKKFQYGKLPLDQDLGPWLKSATVPPIQILPLTAEIVTAAMRLPDFPNRDPADELIVATAAVHGLILLTTDTLLKGYKHVRVQYFTPVLRK